MDQLPLTMVIISKLNSIGRRRYFTITGGSIAVVALGSTGCSIVCSSSPSAESDELDRSLLDVVFCVSALCRGFAKREDILPLCLADN